MQPNVDVVNIVTINELMQIIGPDLTCRWPIAKPGDPTSYRIDMSVAASIIAEQIGSVTVPNQLFYRVGDGGEHDPDPGDITVPDDRLDGEDYYLSKRGVDYMEKGIDWQNDVPGGGWRLLGGISMINGETYTVTFKPKISNILSSADAVGRFAAGIKYWDANGTISASDFRKIQVIRGAKQLILPLASAYPKNVMLTIIALDGPQKQCAVTRQGGDVIVNSTTGITTAYIGNWRYITLITDNTSWFIQSASESMFKDPTLAGGGWMAGINQLVADGTEYNRADLPGVWDFISRLKIANPNAVKNAGDWATNRSYWGEGNGTTTLRVPDLRGRFLRWLDMGAGIDTDRVSDGLQNIPGSPEAQSVLDHYHFAVKSGLFESGNLPPEINRNPSLLRSILEAYSKTSGGGKESTWLSSPAQNFDQAGGIPDVGPTGLMQTSGNKGTGNENRPVNSAFIPLIDI